MPLIAPEHQGWIAVPSPNVTSPMPKKPSGIVIHYTAAGSGKGSANYFAGKAAGVSAHFVIDRDGTVYQCVSLKDKAWHAGVSQWPTGTKQKNCNDFTIGIELANWGWLTKDSAGKVLTYTKAVFNGPTVEIKGKLWEVYPEAMIESLKSVLAIVSTKTGIQINSTNVVGHEHIAPTRKTDPGPAFPWSSIFLPKT
jgi:N-acetylmuramoyl-L-alanine amidase